MPFLERITVGHVISNKNTVNKNTHPQVGGSDLLFYSVLGGCGRVFC